MLEQVGSDFLKNKKVNPKIEEIREKEFANIVEEFSDISKENISVVIRYNKGHYVVFLDNIFEIDWETSDEYDDANNETKEARSKVLAEVEWLQHQPCVQIIDENKRNCYISLLAECWCYALDGCFEIANSHLKRAEQYLNDRKIEKSRKWQLISCFSIIGTFLVGILAINRCFHVSDNFERWVTYLLFGALGTALSLIINGNTRTYNCESGKLLNFLEILSRLIASLLSCLVIVLLFNLNIIFTALKENHSTETLNLLCVIAGFSERLIPSILQKMESAETKEREK